MMDQRKIYSMSASLKMDMSHEQFSVIFSSLDSLSCSKLDGFLSSDKLGWKIFPSPGVFSLNGIVFRSGTGIFTIITLL